MSLPRYALLLRALLLLIVPLPLSAQPQEKDFAIAAEAMPQLVGALEGSIIGISAPGGRLEVTIDFGEVSPLNPNRTVMAIIPVELRAREPFELIASVTATGSDDPYAVQLSDIGLGVQNFRPLGRNATACGAESTLVAPFNNHPGETVRLGPGRASYPASLAHATFSVALVRGPQLSTKPTGVRQGNGYGLDVILVIAPQFFAPGTFLTTLTLQLVPGQDWPCRD